MIEHTVRLKQLYPDSEASYEGKAEVEYHGHTLCCYVVVVNLELWQTLATHASYPVLLYLDRQEPIVTGAALGSSCIQHIEDGYYAVTGNVVHKDDDHERLILESVFTLEVALNASFRQPHPAKDVRQGDTVRVTGILRLDFDPDDDDDYPIPWEQIK